MFYKHASLTHGTKCIFIIFTNHFCRYSCNVICKNIIMINVSFMEANCLSLSTKNAWEIFIVLFSLHGKGKMYAYIKMRFLIKTFFFGDRFLSKKESERNRNSNERWIIFIFDKKKLNREFKLIVLIRHIFIVTSSHTKLVTNWFWSGIPTWLFQFVTLLPWRHLALSWIRFDLDCFTEQL